jgi:hypothetical protein
MNESYAPYFAWGALLLSIALPLALAAITDKRKKQRPAAIRQNQQNQQNPQPLLGVVHPKDRKNKK